MTVSDPTAGIVAYLTTQVGSLVANRVFRPELPRGEDKLMPRACIVVRHAGGEHMFGAGTLPVGDPRIDVYCYGGTRLEADQIGRAAKVALKTLKPQTAGGVKLYWARLVMGPTPIPDSSTLWPMSYLCAQVMHVE